VVCGAAGVTRRRRRTSAGVDTRELSKHAVAPRSCCSGRGTGSEGADAMAHDADVYLTSLRRVRMQSSCRTPVGPSLVPLGKHGRQHGWRARSTCSRPRYACTALGAGMEQKSGAYPSAASARARVRRVTPAAKSALRAHRHGLVVCPMENGWERAGAQACE